MLKSVLFGLLVLSTGVRFVDSIYLLSSGSNLPAAVLGVTAAMVLYGAFLIGKHLIAKVSMKELMAFYLVQAAAIVFNLAYSSTLCPVQLSFAEILAVGTFLDLLVDVCVVYYGLKQMRRPAAAVLPMAREGKVRV